MLIAVGAFGLLTLVGTVGFHAIIGESLFDALYRTLITVYTVGLVSAPDTVGAKLFTLLLVVWGVAIFFYIVGLVVELTVNGTVTGAWQERRLFRRVEGQNDHFIICGYGRVGRRVAEEFSNAGVDYVILDFNEDALRVARERGDIYIQGKGTDDDDLAKAGLARARGLVASADSDADNLYITLSARAARPDLTIVGRASDADAERKLKLAGADRVVTPYATAGRVMANLVLKPQVAAFLDIVTTADGEDFVLEEIEVPRGWEKAGKTIRELRVRDQTGAIIVALRKSDGTFDATPSPDRQLDVGDVLIGVGSPADIRRLEELFAARRGAVGR
jgi:voltage-gated potassium channel